LHDGYDADLFAHLSTFRFQVSGVKVSGNSLIAWRLEGWEARRPEAMKPLSFQASNLSSLPAVLLTPET
jgi:hypothetical protein